MPETQLGSRDTGTQCCLQSPFNSLMNLGCASTGFSAFQKFKGGGKERGREGGREGQRRESAGGKGGGREEGGCIGYECVHWVFAP